MTLENLQKAMEAFKEDNYANNSKRREATKMIVETTCKSEEIVGLAVTFSLRSEMPALNCLAAINAGIEIGLQLAKEIQ